MKNRTHTRGRALLLLMALLVSAALPRVFVVCVSDDDHVSLEAVFEGDPCETKFIFGARAESGWPAVACTDIPAVQLSALGELTPKRVPGAIVVAWLPMPPHRMERRASEPASPVRAIADAAPPRSSAARALRTVVLLI